MQISGEWSSSVFSFLCIMEICPQGGGGGGGVYFEPSISLIEASHQQNSDSKSVNVLPNVLPKANSLKPKA